MKKTLLIPFVLLFLIANSTGAQTGTKSFYISGNINFSSSRSVYFPNSDLKPNTKTSFGFNPNFGYILNKQMIIGLGFNFQQTKIHTFRQSNLPIPYPSWNDFETLSRQLAPSVFFTYMWEFGDRLILGMNSCILYGMEGTHIENFNQTSTSANQSKLTYGTKYLEAGFSPELQFMLTKSLGIQTNFNLFRTTIKVEHSYAAPIRTTEFELNLNPANWVFGIVLYLD
jgi:hypothetical protein